MHFGSDNVVARARGSWRRSSPPTAALWRPTARTRSPRGSRSALAAIFEADVRIFLMPTGTAANGLALGCLAPPWGEIVCHQDAHVMTDECGGPEQWTGGAKITPCPASAARSRRRRSPPRWRLRAAASIRSTFRALAHQPDRMRHRLHAGGNGGAGGDRQEARAPCPSRRRTLHERPRRHRRDAGGADLEGRRRRALPRRHEEWRDGGGGRDLFQPRAGGDGGVPPHAGAGISSPRAGCSPRSSRAGWRTITGWTSRGRRTPRRAGWPRGCAVRTRCGSPGTSTATSSSS